MMKKSDRYLKIVEWSEGDQCYIGRVPGLAFGGVHGKNEKKVYEELCDVVDEWIKRFTKRRGRLYRQRQLANSIPENSIFVLAKNCTNAWPSSQ
jgi:hypothetical protein